MCGLVTKYAALLALIGLFGGGRSRRTIREITRLLGTRIMSQFIRSS